MHSPETCCATPEPGGGGADANLVLIAQRLRELRALLGHDQAAAAAIARVDRTTWVNWERARRKADCVQLAVYCDATGATLDWIYRGRLGCAMAPKLSAELARQHPDAPGADEAREVQKLADRVRLALTLGG